MIDLPAPTGIDGTISLPGTSFIASEGSPSTDRSPPRVGEHTDEILAEFDFSDMEIAQTEVFGPVLSVLSFTNDAQAIEIANGTDYGLVGGVFTADLDRATRAARQLRAGQVFVNEWYAGGVETPFGGYGKSGYGREKGREALWNYVQTKNIAMKLKG